MKIKKLLHLCETKGCMRFANCDVELKHPETGEVLVEKKICSKCAVKLLREASNMAKAGD